MKSQNFLKRNQINRKEAAKRLGISMGLLDIYSLEGNEINFIVDTEDIYFNIEECDRWMKHLNFRTVFTTVRFII